MVPNNTKFRWKFVETIFSEFWKHCLKYLFKIFQDSNENIKKKCLDYF